MILQECKDLTEYPKGFSLVTNMSLMSEEKLDWLLENHLRPLFEEVVKSLSELQRLGIAPPGDPALLFNMIRVSAGGLLALAVEIKGTSNLDFNSQQALDDLSDMIIRCFLPGEVSTSS